MEQLTDQKAIDYLTHLGQFGRLENGGVTRFVYDDAWIAAMNHVLRDARTRGMAASVDSYGNGFMTYQGKTADQVVAAGSHIDTVNQGGLYDGAYGVTAAVLAMSSLVAEFGQPKKTMTAVAFSEEEGSRFPTSFSGSKHYAGVTETAADLQDHQGMTFGQARQSAVSQLAKTWPVIEQPLPIEFLELHIEQGPILEEKGLSVGIVSAICEQKRFTVTVRGQTNHAGTTPQHLRRDALKAAAKLICDLDEAAGKIGEPLVFTVGELTVQPGSSNVIPGLVKFSVDVRHPDKQIVDQFEALLRKKASQTPKVTVQVDRWLDSRPAIMDARLKHQFEQLIAKRGLAYMTLPSGAGHDTQIMNLKVPTAMLFVPSRNGISHSPKEYTAPADLETGITILKAQLYQECY
ncbi:M20 family metallo-hydrolase [Lentilactobacillus farraginis]|nr:M20 family metallo-hydrolase [Lentilactobacillus farraginis]